MSELGALLELIHDAHLRVRTFEAEYRDWNRPPPSLEFNVARSELGETQIHWHGGGPFPKAVASTRRIWLMAPSLRVEIVDEHQLVGLGVLNSERWWRWDREWGPVSGELMRGGSARGTPPPPLLAPPLLDPAGLLALLRFEAIGSAVVAGRNVVSARAVPRRPQPVNWTLRYEFDFDAQHGTVLRRAVLYDGRVVSTTEAMAVAYDGPIDEERFVFTSPDGRAVRDFQTEAVAPSGPPNDLRLTNRREVRRPTSHSA